MFTKKSVIVLAALMFLGFLSVSAANAQTTCPYTLASLNGSYSAIANYGSYVAVAFGTRIYDGNGNFTGSYILNAPTTGSTTGARTITTGTQVGTYTVNCNGTGVVTRTLTSSTGVVTNQSDDFIITGATMVGDWVGGNMVGLATNIADAQETPSALVPGGLFVTRTFTRLPDVRF